MPLSRLGMLLWLAFVCSCALPPAPQEAVSPGHRVYMTKSYRYLPGSPAGDADIGLSLCGTRCNALSADDVTYTEPGGWALTRIATDSEIRLPLDNPFFGGECLCVVDEYLARIGTLSTPDGWSPTRP